VNKDAVDVALVRGPVVSVEGAFNNEATPAIGLAYLAASAEQIGFKVEIIDAIGEGLNIILPLEGVPGYVTQGISIEKTVAKIPKTISVIGFSAMFSGEWPVVRRIIEAARQRFPNALLVAGGEHATALPEFSLRECSALNLVVKGEGEGTFAAVLESQAHGGDFKDIPGICFIDEAGQFHDSGVPPRIRELREIPRPAWPEEYLEKFWESGKSFGVQTARDMPMLASRGCPYQCTFCSNPSMWTTRYILRDIDDLLDEIKTYKNKYDVTAIQFYDLTAVTKKRWIVEYCQRLLEDNIDLKWSLPSGTRSEALDEETLSLLSATNCNYLVYAPESGSPQTLEIIKKQIDLVQITKSMRTAKRLGLTIRANLIIGFPSERRRNVYQTLLYGLRLAILGVDEVPVFIYSAYPGSQIFEDLIKDGKIELNDDYFFGLTALNSKINVLRPKIYNPYIPAFELALYRLVFMLSNYLIGYLRFPKRIIRSLRNIYGEGPGHEAVTVFEHRLKDARNRKNKSAKTPTI